MCHYPRERINQSVNYADVIYLQHSSHAADSLELIDNIMTFLLCLYLDQHKITSLDIYPFSSDLETPLLGYMNTVTFLEDSKTFTCFQLSLILTPQTYTAKDTGSGSKMLLFFSDVWLEELLTVPQLKQFPHSFYWSLGRVALAVRKFWNVK